MAVVSAYIRVFRASGMCVCVNICMHACACTCVRVRVLVYMSHACFKTFVFCQIDRFIQEQLIFVTKL